MKCIEKGRTEKETKAFLGNDDGNKTSATFVGSCGQFKEDKNTKVGNSSQVRQTTRVITQSQDDLDDILAQEEANKFINL